jgi:Heterokaryon incompatibility protein (HET)
VNILGPELALERKCITDANGEDGEYAALSYCWGGDQPMKTEQSNLESHRCGINVDSLPQTLQDAVKTTRALGLKYLWIDALCIIQDDHSDKFRKIGKMPEVYGESTITIVAAKAKTVFEGFLHYNHQPCTIRVKMPGGAKGHFSVTPDDQPIFSGAALNSRGWVLQESLLPPRLLVYAKHEAAWRCRKIDCQPVLKSWIDYSKEVVVPPRSLGKPQGKKLHRDHWDNLVQDYTQRKLTVLDDRVWAIAGVITVLSQTWNDDCIFGLISRSRYNRLSIECGVN